MLADEFSSVFVEGVHPISAQHQILAACLEEVYVSFENVVKVLFSLNSSSASGPDGLHPHLMKAKSAALSLPIYFLAVRSLNKVKSNL